MDLVFDYYFNFLSAKTEINKKRAQFNKSRWVRSF